GTTPSTFTTTSTTTPTPPVSTETPPRTSTSTGTTPSTFTTTSTTTTTPTPPVSTETPPTASKSTGTTPSTFTTTSTTTTTPLPPTSTETASTTSTTTGTTPSTYTTTSTTTTTHAPPTSTEIPSKTSTTSSTTPTLTFTSTTTSSTNTPIIIVHGHTTTPPLNYPQIVKTTVSTPFTPTSTSQSTILCFCTNETFSISNCTMAKCIKGDVIEIAPLQCPLLQNITCENHQPTVLVYDKRQCCQQYACDCFCQGWGNSHYITFDGLFYSYQGNCTYILMEEIRPQYHLKIYIDYIYCDIGEHASCPRSITASYNDQVITLRNHIGGADLEALKDNVKLTLPYAHHGVRVISSGLDLFLSIPELNVDITFRTLGFSINLPLQHFGNNTQGHCGTCNNNQADDCMIPGGILVNDCEVMADYWPASGVNGKNCQPTPKPPVLNISPPMPKTPCPAQSECNLLESKLFDACHSHVPPKNFFLACQLDSCNMNNSTMVCASLQSYASACSQVGVCIHWRNYTKHCNIKCSEDKIFLPCVPSEPPTCRDGPMQSITVPTEGCFCPENTILFNKESGLCVPKCGCLDPSGTPREYDERFRYNCEDCVCDRASQSVFCKPKECPDVNPEICTERGFVLVNVTNPSEPCCSKQVCHCAIDMCPSGSCTQGSCIYDAPDKTRHVLKVHLKTFSIFSVHQTKNLLCSSVFWLSFCRVERSTSTNVKLLPGFEYVKKDGECCGSCRQVACIYDAPDKTRHVLKVHLKIFSNFSSIISYYFKCMNATCLKRNGMFMIMESYKQCPPFNPDDCVPVSTASELEEHRLHPCSVKYIKKDNSILQPSDWCFLVNPCRYSMEKNIMMHNCSCCQEEKFSQRQVMLKCANSSEILHDYIYVESCRCTPTKCDEYTEKKNPVQSPEHFWEHPNLREKLAKPYHKEYYSRGRY
uniref:VWFD domain-containing protein n=1 Tax=Sinocyclocheilus rhinocerous TaxID=307959 RepID=A0A673MPX9_9TELE